MKGNYISYNPFSSMSYEVIGGKDFIKKTTGVVSSLCSSYLTAESPNNLKDFYKSNGSNMAITDGVWGETHDKNCGAFQCGNSESKNWITEKILRINTNSSRFPELNDYGNVDKSTTLLAKDYEGIVITCDYDVAASARYLNIPYIFKIPEEELKRFNGPINFLEEHRKKINIEVNKIKSKI